MKKMLLFLIICSMFCGCSKSPNEPLSDVSDIPNEPMIIETTPTEEPTPILKPCDICHKTGNCKPYDSEKYYYEKQEFITTTFYICEDCWQTVMDSETDIDNYKSLSSALQMVAVDKKAETYYHDKDVDIVFDNSGVHIENDDWLVERLGEILGKDFLNTIHTVTGETYILTLTNMSFGLTVQATQKPKSLLYPDD